MHVLRNFRVFLGPGLDAGCMAANPQTNPSDLGRRDENTAVRFLPSSFIVITPPESLYTHFNSP